MKSSLLDRAKGAFMRLAVVGYPARTWRGVKVVDATEHGGFIDIIEGALALIEQASPSRAARIARCLDLIVNRPLAHEAAAFGRLGDQRVCWIDLGAIDAQFGLGKGPPAPGGDPRESCCAAILVHEAAHAALDAAGLRNDENTRARHERLCCQESVRLMRRLLPDPKVQAEIEQAFRFESMDFDSIWKRGRLRRAFDEVAAQLKPPR